MSMGNTLGSVAGRCVAKTIERNLDNDIDVFVFLETRALRSTLLVKAVCGTQRQFHKHYSANTRLHVVQKDIRNWFRRTK